MRRRRPTIALAVTAAVVASPALAALADGVDAAVDTALRDTGVPSAPIAVVLDGRIALSKAYGRARLDPPVAATPSMRYPIGSISKQFTAALLVLLARDGKLDLDAPVATWFPDLTRSGDVTVRQLLSHTSGIRDYWPQDYVPASMLEPTTPAAVMAAWAKRPLDFEPGTRYQYSNTGYVVAGAIAEKVGGKPLMTLLRERIFEPLGMTTVLNVDRGRLSETDATGYLRYGLGPLRRAPKEGEGWLFAAAPLAMTAGDLATWDVALLDGTIPVLPALAREVLLANGAGTGYGLGVGIALDGDRRVVRHGGEVSGFTAQNRIYPDDRAAIVVLVNQDATDAAGTIADRIAEQLFVAGSPSDSTMRVRVAAMLGALRKGKIDRAQLTPNASAYFSEEALRDLRAGFRHLGRLERVEPGRRSDRGGLTTRTYRAVFKKRTLDVVTRATSDGKLEQLTVSPE